MNINTAYKIREVEVCLAKTLLCFDFGVVMVMKKGKKVISFAISKRSGTLIAIES